MRETGAGLCKTVQVPVTAVGALRFRSAGQTLLFRPVHVIVSTEGNEIANPFRGGAASGFKENRLRHDGRKPADCRFCE